MKATITIDMDNAAFEDNPNELGDILAGIRQTLAEYPWLGRSGGFSLFDSNGNRVGQLVID